VISLVFYSNSLSDLARFSVTYPHTAVLSSSSISCSISYNKFLTSVYS